MLSSLDDGGVERDSSAYQLETIWAFSKDNIWVTNGFQMANWDGKKWNRINPQINSLNGSMNKIWANSPKEIYLIGTNGSIVFFNGTTFTKMNSGTTNQLDDIWGTSSSNIWAVGNDPDGILLHYDGIKWETYDHIVYSADDFEPPTNYLKAGLFSVFQYSEKDSLYVSTSWGIQKRSRNKDGKASWVYERRWQTDENAIGIPLRLRGITANDLFAIGDRGVLLHFNGKTWRRYSDINNRQAQMKSIDVRKNIIVGVGTKLFAPFSDNGTALIVRGYR